MVHRCGARPGYVIGNVLCTILYAVRAGALHVSLVKLCALLTLIWHYKLFRAFDYVSWFSRSKSAIDVFLLRSDHGKRK